MIAPLQFFEHLMTGLNLKLSQEHRLHISEFGSYIWQLGQVLKTH